MILFNRRLGSEMKSHFVLITFRDLGKNGAFQPGNQFGRRQNNRCRTKQNMGPFKYGLYQMLFIQHKRIKALLVPTMGGPKV
jgi:hypothetical protein